MNDIIYFEVNNWFRGRDYPDLEEFYKWMENDLEHSFYNKKWVEENKLVVVCSIVDMSINYCVSAPREWIEENCPRLLEPRFEKFIRKPDYDDIIEGRFGCPFLEYNEENIGLHYAIEKEDDQGYFYYKLERA